ncbi:hypothetical protein AOLI_G00204930 [Acnodon oligacanthus]
MLQTDCTGSTSRGSSSFLNVHSGQRSSLQLLVICHPLCYYTIMTLTNQRRIFVGMCCGKQSESRIDYISVPPQLCLTVTW